METPAVIDIRNLTHRYKTHYALGGSGTGQALGSFTSPGVTFTIGARSIHGFVGPNGAGKTTTLKILATLLKPQQGSVAVFGHDILKERQAVRRVFVTRETNGKRTTERVFSPGDF